MAGVCPPGQLGRFPHATDCAKFVMCANEEGHEFSCPKGLLYDPPTKDCTWPEKANCRPTNINLLGKAVTTSTTIVADMRSRVRDWISKNKCDTVKNR